MTVGVARKGDGLRRKEGRRNDGLEKFFGSLFSKKGLLASLLGLQAGDGPATGFGTRAKFPGSFFKKESLPYWIGATPGAGWLSRPPREGGQALGWS
jgi:hypothetical protein